MHVGLGSGRNPKKNDRTKNLARPDFCLTPKTPYSVAAVFVASTIRKEIDLIRPPYGHSLLYIPYS